MLTRFRNWRRRNQLVHAFELIPDKKRKARKPHPMETPKRWWQEFKDASHFSKFVVLVITIALAWALITDIKLGRYLWPF